MFLVLQMHKIFVIVGAIITGGLGIVVTVFLQVAHADDMNQGKRSTC